MLANNITIIALQLTFSKPILSIEIKKKKNLEKGNKRKTNKKTSRKVKVPYQIKWATFRTQPRTSSSNLTFTRTLP